MAHPEQLVIVGVARDELRILVIVLHGLSVRGLP
jgi:hypothetical protein